MSVNADLEKAYAAIDEIIKHEQNNCAKLLFYQYKTALNRIKAELKNIYANHGQEIEQKIFQINRLKSLEENIFANIMKIKYSDMEIIPKAITDIFILSFEQNKKTLQENISVRLNIGSLDDAAIKASIENPYDKIGWPKRLQVNIADTIDKTRTEVTQGILRGQPYSQTAKILSDRLEIGANKAITIVRTETGRATSEARLEVFDRAKESADKLGLEIDRVWIHSGNSRDPHPDHVKMDGQKAGDDGMFTFPLGPNRGKKTKGPRLSGYPEEDINCGCSEKVVIKGHH